MTRDSLQQEPSISKPMAVIGALTVTGILPMAAGHLLGFVTGAWIIPVGIAAIVAFAWSVIR